MMRVLRGLGPEYNMLLTAMINSSPLLSFTELQSKINTFGLQNPRLCFRCLLRWTISSLNPPTLAPGSTIAIPIAMEIIVATTKEDTGVLIATLNSQWNGPWNFHRNSIHSRFRKHYVEILFSYQILHIYIYQIFILEILFSYHIMFSLVFEVSWLKLCMFITHCFKSTPYTWRSINRWVP